MPGLFDGASREFLNANPRAALHYLFPEANTNSAFGRFIRDSDNRLYNSYLADAARDQAIEYPDWLKAQNLQSQFGNLAPSQRGLQADRFAPRLRMTGNIFGG